MKKKIIAALSIVMLFSAFSCRGNKNPSSEQTSNIPTSEVTSVDSTKEESTQSEQPSEEPSQEVTSEESTVAPSTEESTEQSSEEQSSDLTTETPSTSEEVSNEATTNPSSGTTSEEVSSENTSINNSSSEEITSESSSSIQQESSTIEFVIANKQWDEGLTYITNSSEHPDPSFYSDGGLKMNFVKMGFETKNPLTPSNSVAVTLIVNALNENTKSGTDADAFTIYGLNSSGQVVAEAGLENVVVGENLVTLNGQGIVKVKVVMTDYAHNGNKFCNVSVGGLIVTSSGNGSQGETSSETPTTSETPSTSETTSNNPSSNNPSSEDTTTSENTSADQSSESSSENTSNNQTTTNIVDVLSLSFNGLKNKESADSYMKTNFSDWVINGKLGNGYENYLGFGRDGDKTSGIKSPLFSTTNNFTLTVILKGNGTKTTPSTLTFKILDANGEVIAESVTVEPIDGQDKTVEVVFTYNSGKSYSDASYLEISFNKVNGNIGLKSLEVNLIDNGNDNPGEEENSGTSENISSNTPSSSEEVSSESTTNPSSGTTSEEVSSENTSTNESSSNSSTDDSSSNIVLQDSYVITFNESNVETDRSSNPSNLLNLQNGITFASATKLFSDDTKAIRLGADSAVGNIKFNLDPNVKVTSVIIKGELYNASKDGSVGLEVSLSNNIKENTIVNGKFEEVFTFTSNQESSYLLIATNNEGKKPRVLITEIIVNYAIEGGEGENQESSSIPTNPESGTTSADQSSESSIESTTNPSIESSNEEVSSENTSTNESSSNSSTDDSSSNIVLQDSYVITFNNYKTETDLSSNPSSLLNLQNGITFASATKLFSDETNAIRLGASSAVGNIKFNLDPNVKVTSVIIKGALYNASNDGSVGLEVSLSNNIKENTVVNGEFEEVFTFTSNQESSYLLIATNNEGKKPRVLITEIIVNYAIEGGQGGSQTNPE